jgi:hypothetical protein
VAGCDVAEMFQRLRSSPRGLNDEEAAERFKVFGANHVAGNETYLALDGDA